MADVKFEFDPFELAGIEPPERASDRREALSEISEFVLEQVLSHVGDQNSPVAGYGKFPALSKSYKEFKRSEGGTPVPNLELSGDMLNALKVKSTREGTIVMQITGKQGDKADGHNNHSGDSSLPLRRFIPAEDETFKRGILEGIARIAELHR